MAGPIGCAVIGYGPLHNFGWAHSAWISATEGLRLVGICDRDPARRDAAHEAFPAARLYADPAEIWADDEVQLVSIVTPHFTHCDLAVEAFTAGRHVVVEKAMCLSVGEASRMIAMAREAGRTLAVHHNRRHDGNFRRLRELVQGGAIGEVFHVELSAGGWFEPQNGWYREKATSGGGFYYWGPHAVDWVLDLLGDQVVGVNGYYHKLVWHAMSNEDQTRAVLRFANGAVADICWSTIAAVGGKPLWRILGTGGGILDTGAGGNVGYQEVIHGPAGGELTLVTTAGGRHETRVPYLESDWDQYWRDLADHLLHGAPVPVSGEAGRRTIAVFEAAERSSLHGQTEQVEYEYD